MGWLEAVVVVYLRTAIGLNPAVVIPAQDPATVGTFEMVEIARELATLVMIATVGWLAGRSGLERLAWAAVVFGIWDIVYYAGLRLILGWPPAFDSWDVLFLVPAAWVGPIWAPIAVSAALIGYGLAAARRLRSGGSIALTGWHAVAAVAGGVLVVISFLVDADRVLRGEPIAWTGWPIFVAGMALAMVASTHALRRVGPVVLLIAIVAACGQSEGSPVAPTTAPPATPTAAPTELRTAAATEPATTVPPSPSASSGPTVTIGPTPTASATAAPSLTVPDRWSRGPDAPIALTEVAAAAHDGRVWVAGGLDADGTASDRVLILDPSTGTWSDGPSLPEGVHHAALVSTGDALFLVGGYVDQFPARRPPRSVASTSVPARGPTRRRCPSRAQPARRHGTAPGSSSAGAGPRAGRQTRCSRSIPSGWHELGRLSTAREHLGAASDGAGRTWFLGGRVAGLGTNLGIVDLVSPDGSQLLRAELTPAAASPASGTPRSGRVSRVARDPAAPMPKSSASMSRTSCARCRPWRSHATAWARPSSATPIHVVLGGPNPGLFVSAAVETLDLAGG